MPPDTMLQRSALVQKTGFWASVFAVLSVLVQVAGVVHLPDPYGRYLDGAAAIAGAILAAVFGHPSMRPPMGTPRGSAAWKILVVVALVLLLAAAATGCSSDTNTPAPTPPTPQPQPQPGPTPPPAPTPTAAAFDALPIGATQAEATAALGQPYAIARVDGVLVWVFALGNGLYGEARWGTDGKLASKVLD